MQIDYASIGVSEAPLSPEVFCTRQLTIPFGVMVRPSAKCTALHILPIPTSALSTTRRHATGLNGTSLGRFLEEEPSISDILGEIDGEEKCLLVLEVTNTSSTDAFEINLQHQFAHEHRAPVHSPKAKLTRRVDALATANFALPIQRFSLSSEDVTRPIPTLSDKQFVVGRDRTTSVETELFWYRERLVSGLSLNWRDANASRSGSIDVSRLSLTEAMVAALQIPELSITTTLSVDGIESERDDQGRWLLLCGDFVEMAMRVHNRGGESIFSGIERLLGALSYD